MKIRNCILEQGDLILKIELFVVYKFTISFLLIKSGNNSFIVAVSMRALGMQQVLELNLRPQRFMVALKRTVHIIIEELISSFTK